MKRLIYISLVLLITAGLFGCAASNPPSASPGASSSGTLTIAAASSLTEPLNEIIANYAAVKPDVKITPIYGGSGALQTQIQEGAPVDLFFPAASKQMDALDKAGLIVQSATVNLLQNEIVLVVPADLPVKVGSFGDIATQAVSKIALGDPKSVPAGQYAQETLTSLDIWEQASAKATFGTDVKQVLSWVEDGSVDCGIVYKTDALQDKNVQIIAEAPGSSHTSIVYPVSIVKASVNQDAAEDFIKYLQSDAALAVFEEYGFLTD